jgi:hypothetical protein
VLDDIPALILNKIESEQIKQGQKIELNLIESKDKFLEIYPNHSEFEKIYAVENDKIVALIKIYEGMVKPARIINI